MTVKQGQVGGWLVLFRVGFLWCEVVDINVACKYGRLKRIWCFANKDVRMEDQSDTRGDQNDAYSHF